jgi:hypothetical protein
MAMRPVQHRLSMLPGLVESVGDRSHRQLSRLRQLRRVAAVAALTLLAPLVAVASSPARAAPPVRVEPAPAAVPDAQDALAAAKRHGTDVEVLSKRTETTEVFATPTGAFRSKEYLVAAWARNAGGSWVRPDATLRRQPDGSVAPVATTFPLRFSGGGDGPFAAVKRAGSELELGWPGRLPEPVLSGNNATYVDVLPGVDLRVTAETEGFTHALVVKDRQAATNPALARIKLRTAVRNGSLHVDPVTGGVSMLDAAGKTVLGGATPTMWDSTGTNADPRIQRLLRNSSAAEDALLGERPPPREKRVRTTVRPGELELIPDLALLHDPTAVLPIVIDPPWSGRRNHWTVLRQQEPDTSFYDRAIIATGDEVKGTLRAGYQSGFGDPASRGRVLVELDTSLVARAQIFAAQFRVFQQYSSKGCANGTEAGGRVGVYHTNPFGAWTTWNNNISWPHQDHYIASHTSVRRYDCSGAYAPNWIGFDVGGTIANHAAAGGTAITLGLRAPNENDVFSWKRYHVNTNYWSEHNPVLIIEYNFLPGVPTDLRIRDDLPCAAQSGQVYVSGNAVTLSAALHDRDNAVNAEFELWQDDGPVILRQGSGQVGDGQRVSVTIPAAGNLTPGGRYAWRAHPYNVIAGYGTYWGDFSEWCDFVYEPAGPTRSPLPPTIASDDFFPDEEIGPTLVGQPGRFRFGPGGATDVVAYRYGFRQDALTMTVAANPDGGVEVPVTVWHDAPAELWVQSVDRAGNVSIGADNTPATGISRYRFQAAYNPGPFPRKPRDFNGDGKGDILTTVDAGNGRTQIWNLTARANGSGQVHEAVNIFDAPGYPADRIRSMRGDFNGDGRDDTAMFRSEEPGRVTLWRATSDGNSLVMGGAPDWDSGPPSNGWVLGAMIDAIGDFNRDGRDDIAVFYSSPGPLMRIFIWSATPTGFTAPVDVYNNQGWDGSRHRVVAGDFNNDGADDLAATYDHGGCNTALWVWWAKFDGAWGFHPPNNPWLSGPGGWCSHANDLFAGDFDGNGHTDIGTFYFFGNGDMPLWMFPGQNLIAGPVPLWNSGTDGWYATNAEPIATDLNGDNKDEVVLVRRCCGAHQTVVHSWSWNGTGMGAPVQRWRGALGPIGVGSVRPVLGARYQFVANHSGKCLGAPGTSTANYVQLDQETCDPNSVRQQFILEPVGGAQFTLRLAHTAGLCVGVTTAASGGLVVQFGCVRSYDQRLTLEYVAGDAKQPVVRIRPLHTDMCLDVRGWGVNDGTLVDQYPCWTTPLNWNNQLFNLRRV